MARAILLAFGFLRCRLWRIISLGAVLAAAVLVGVNWWAWHHFRAAEQALHHENLAEATWHISRCLHVWGRGSETHLLAARIDRAAGRFAEAENHLNECVRLQHGASEATQLETFLLRAQTGELREVEKGLWKCVNAGHPESARILETLARAYLDEFRWGAAELALTYWLALEPRSAQAWHWRGWLNERLQQSDKAIPNYEKAVELDPDRWGARLRLVRLLLRRSRAETARVHLEVLMGGHADDPTVQLAQAWNHMLQGQDEEAIRLLDRLLQTNPRDCEALFLRGELAAQQVPPRYSEAEDFFRRCLAENPADTLALLSLSLCLKHQGKEKQAAQAREDFVRVESDVKRLTDLVKVEVERAPQNPNVFSEVGELLMRLGDEEAGLNWLQRALQLSPTHKRSHEILIRYFQTKGKSAEAERIRKRFFELTGSKIDDAPAAKN